MSNEKVMNNFDDNYRVSHNGNYCGKCKHICVSIHTNDYKICGLKYKSVHWWNVCNNFEFVDKRIWLYNNSYLFNYYINGGK